jgi:four helix bundle protein
MSERPVDWAARLIKVVDALPPTVTGKHLGAQLLRCSTSSGANYEEARGAESRRDFLHKLGIALKELPEARYWLRVVERAAALKQGRLDGVIAEATELCRILGASKATARKLSRPAREN